MGLARGAIPVRLCPWGSVRALHVVRLFPWGPARWLPVGLCPWGDSREEIPVGLCQGSALGLCVLGYARGSLSVGTGALCLGLCVLG